MTRTETGQMDGFKPPREDINSPDLYIPGNVSMGSSCIVSDMHVIVVMALVTYILFCGLAAGQQGS